MGRNLTDLYISESFNHLVQISGSDFTTGVGILVTSSLANPINITVASASYALSASFEIVKEVSSSYADFAQVAGIATSSLNATSASHAVISDSSLSAISSSFASTAISSSHALSADTSISSSHAVTASYALNGGSGAAFPFTGSASISGSLTVDGPITATGQVTDTIAYPAVGLNTVRTLTGVTDQNGLSYPIAFETYAKIPGALQNGRFGVFTAVPGAIYSTYLNGPQSHQWTLRPSGSTGESVFNLTDGGGGFTSGSLTADDVTAGGTNRTTLGAQFSQTQVIGGNVTLQAGNNASLVSNNNTALVSNNEVEALGINTVVFNTSGVLGLNATGATSTVDINARNIYRTRFNQGGIVLSPLAGSGETFGAAIDKTYGFNIFKTDFSIDTGFALNLDTVTGGGVVKPGFYTLGGGAYRDLISFQDTTNYTDGRIEFHTPISASAGITGSLSGTSTNATSASYASVADALTAGNKTITGDLNVTGSINISQTMNLASQDPLPTGVVGDLAVSGSGLYFNNGTSWSLIS